MSFTGLDGCYALSIPIYLTSWDTNAHSTNGVPQVLVLGRASLAKNRRPFSNGWAAELRILPWLSTLGMM